MNAKIPSLVLLAAMALPGLAAARPVTLSTEMSRYGGPGAYLAIYVTDANGGYQSTLWVAGRQAKYYKHLSDWRQSGGGDQAGIDGMTGASVGAGSALTVQVEVADALIDAGFEIHIDAAVEDFRDSPSEVVVPLTSAGAGAPVSGRAYIAAFAYDM